MLCLYLVCLSYPTSEYSSHTFDCRLSQLMSSALIIVYPPVKKHLHIFTASVSKYIYIYIYILLFVYLASEPAGLQVLTCFLQKFLSIKDTITPEEILHFAVPNISTVLLYTAEQCKL